MTEVNLRIEGLDELQAALAAVGDEAFQAAVLGHGFIAAARVVRKRAKATIPYGPRAKSGHERHLRDTVRAVRRSWRIWTIKDRQKGGRHFKKVRGAAAEVIVGGEGAMHAYIVEYGTSTAAPKLYLTRAIEDTKAEQTAAMVKAAQRVFTKVVRDAAAGQKSTLVKRLVSDSS